MARGYPANRTTYGILADDIGPDCPQCGPVEWICEPSGDHTHSGVQQQYPAKRFSDERSGEWEVAKCPNCGHNIAVATDWTWDPRVGMCWMCGAPLTWYAVHTSRSCPECQVSLDSPEYRARAEAGDDDYVYD